MKHFKTLAAVLLIFFLTAAGCKKIEPESPYTTQLLVSKVPIWVEILNTDKKRQQGLSGRQPLSEEQGALFDFKNTGQRRPGFWMKDMKFNLDLIWIRDGKIVGITPDVPAPLEKNSELPFYFPPEEISHVLEVNAGWSNTHAIKTGDEVNFYSTDH